jgi:hypothetical protein
MMNKVSGSIFVCAAVALLLTGCQREAPSALKEEPRQVVVADATPIPQLPTRDPSLPDAATVLAAEDAAAKAKAMQDTAELQQKAAPQEDMTKAEEAKAMPLPSQANDHSTTALDKNGETALKKNGDEERGR